MKSVQIRSFFWSVFFRIRTEYREIRSISPYSVQMRENTVQKKRRIWTLFTQCRALSQRSIKDLLILSLYFTSSVSFVVFHIISLQRTLNSHAQKVTVPLIFIFYIAYFEFLLYNVFLKVGNKYWQTFFKGLFLLLLPTNYIWSFSLNYMEIVPFHKISTEGN